MLEDGALVRPAFDGNFAITMSGSDAFLLVSPTMKAPRPFVVRTGARPTPGQRFIQCSSGPCLVHLHGTVTLLGTMNVPTQEGGMPSASRRSLRAAQPTPPPARRR